MKKDFKNLPYYLVRLQNKEEIEFLTKFLKFTNYKITSNSLTYGKVPVMIRKDRKEAFMPTDVSMKILCDTYSAKIVEENIFALEEFINYVTKIKNEDKTF